MSDERTITALRQAADAATRNHRLEPGVAAAAWTTAHAPRRPTRHRVAIAACAFGAAIVAVALAFWSGRGGHANPPGTGSACVGNVTDALLPTWARSGFTGSGLHAPHVTSDHGEIAAVLFVQLRVDQPPGVHNKVLWVARVGSGPLRIDAQLQGTSRRVTRELPNIGPSYVDMPAPGCWQMHLAWSGHHDTIALRYRR